MQNFITPQLYKNKQPSLSEYVSIPSLVYVKNLYDVLNNVSFSSTPVENGGQSVYLNYTEGSSVYTLGWYNIHYDRTFATLSHFATANLRGIKPSFKQKSYFAAKTHLLRTPLSGLGSTLFKHVMDVVKQQNFSRLKISSEATAVPFYIKMSKKFSDHFSHIDENYTRYADGGCDFDFTFKQ
ncbi:MAG: hypothetical protein NT085_03845 [candidate division SR1 bacterium]|nr:hypothetical protein [candidate division SR1 bacterium]